MVTLAGIDLAWLSSRNPTAIAWGDISDQTLRLTRVVEHILGTKALTQQLESGPELTGVAIDAPLIIVNNSGCRACEKAVSREYGGRKSSCHPSNLGRHPNADSVALAGWLDQAGHQHLGRTCGRWQLECYPHPAIIEIFGLKERHLYKKGTVATRRNGQVQLAHMLLSLSTSTVLSLHVDSEWSHYFSEEHIRRLRGTSLKHNEDILDSILCLYIAGLYQIGIADKVFGNSTEGYIYVPQILCI